MDDPIGEPEAQWGFNASLPMDDGLLNLTSAGFLAKSGFEGALEFPSGPLGTIVFAVLVLMAFLLVVAYCYNPKNETALAATLAQMLLSVPAANAFGVAGGEDGENSGADHWMYLILGWYSLVLLVVALALSILIVQQAFFPAQPAVILKSCPEWEGKEYPHPYVGCGVCGAILTKDWFASCVICTQKKVGGTAAFELCRTCLMEHDETHQVLIWEKDVCTGEVDFPATHLHHKGDQSDVEPLVNGAAGS